MTGLVASIVEAYGELRVSKGRILLSLIGVAFSVFALTLVMSGGLMMQQAIQQSLEAFAGRSAIIQVQSNMDAPDASVEDADREVLDRFDELGITQRSRQVDGQLRLQTGHGVIAPGVKAVDPSWGPMHRVDILEGRWLADTDQERLAPSLVVDETLYEKLGRPDLGSETVSVVGDGGVTVAAVVIGVIPASDLGGPDGTGYVAIGSTETFPKGSGMDGAPRSYLAWVPPEQADDVSMALTDRLDSTPTGSYSAFRVDGGQVVDVFRYVRYALMGVAVMILVLGALGLVNIALVTIRYRVREIGIRRSYGATGMRIFVGVLMESVVATVIAGAIGVACAVALVRAPFVADLFQTMGLVEVPPFPVVAVIVGMVAATAVGILAGAVPALIATRIKVIDAIRS